MGNGELRPPTAPKSSSSLSSWRRRKQAWVASLYQRNRCKIYRLYRSCVSYTERNLLLTDCIDLLAVFGFMYVCVFFNFSTVFMLFMFTSISVLSFYYAYPGFSAWSERLDWLIDWLIWNDLPADFTCPAPLSVPRERLSVPSFITEPWIVRRYTHRTRVRRGMRFPRRVSLYKL